MWLTSEKAQAQIARLERIKARPQKAYLQVIKAKRKGEQFGLLNPIRIAGATRSYELMWLCQCLCGGSKLVPSSKLISKQVKSCGCLIAEHRKTYLKSFYKFSSCLQCDATYQTNKTRTTRGLCPTCNHRVSLKLYMRRKRQREYDKRNADN